MKVTRIIMLAAGALGLGFIIWAIVQSFNAPKSESFISYNDLVKMSEQVDLSGYDLNKVNPADEQSGGYAEHVEGNINKAKVVIFEYADFQCSYCAYFNPTVNQILSDFGDDVAVVFRTYLLSYHDKGVHAAAAAEAAGKQGYWQAYKDKLFEEQDNWFYSKQSEFKKQLDDYFVLVTGGKGDLEKFHEDMLDKNIEKKLALDLALGGQTNLEGTPAFYIDGQAVKVTELHDKVAQLLGK